ncbi:MAG: DNA mismatch repair protein MutS [Deltaproteobacteria bacterium]|nr:DNA mismatch repair protein MutS [Deltaproteobacteria bacterium]
MTPMIQQYLEIKAQHRDAILFFRLGDFYEMFFEDAQLASKLLNITLTSRNRNEPNPIPLCGVPYHSADGYIQKLTSLGHKVAICEQTGGSEDGAIFERRVIRIATPGLIHNPDTVEAKESCYVGSFYEREGRFGLAILDLTTGDFQTTELEEIDSLLDELGRVQPREIVVSEKTLPKMEWIRDRLGDVVINTLPEEAYQPGNAKRKLLEQLRTTTLSPSGCDGMELAVVAAGSLATYLQENQKQIVDHIRELKTYFPQRGLILDESALRNLEILQPAVGGERRATLLAFLDHTQTAMGGRELRKTLTYPLKDVQQINRRLDAIETLQKEVGIYRYLLERLGQIYDLERLSTKFSLGNGNAQDLVAIRSTLAFIRGMKETLLNLSDPLIREIVNRMDPLSQLQELLARAVIDDPPPSVREGGVFREGYHIELDDLRKIQKGGKQWIAELERKERKRTKIGSLKVAYNKVFGYYIEVTKPNLSWVPAEYIRKQTVSNAERFITPELKEYEEKVLHAEERILALEYDLFCELRDRVRENLSPLLATARAVGEMDVLAALTQISLRLGYVRPQVEESESLEIEEGRHPVLESFPEMKSFVPNSVRWDTKDQQILIVTGPNMSGKSTILRQTALIVIMAQIGSFVPARSARIGVVDRIFTRVGAMDRISRGESTFMVEMSEMGNILRHATRQSLILLDEVGRGTSTFDGISIAWAIVEYLHRQIGAKTLFATHYHELAELPKVLSKVHNWTVAVREWNNKILFLHKLIPGVASHSYGIQVAELAGLPSSVLERAKQILKDLESESLGMKVRKEDSEKVVQPSLFEPPSHRWTEILKEMDPDRLTPIQALQWIQQWKKDLM